MPFSGPRTSHAFRSLTSVRTEPPKDWFKQSIAMYLVAMIPYLLQSISTAEFWSISQRTAWALELAGASTFLANSLFDLWVSLLLGGFSLRVQEEEPTPKWAQLWPLLGNLLRRANWFLLGSILYVLASLLYLAAPIYYHATSTWSPTHSLYISAATVFVVHALVCLTATLVKNTEQSTRPTTMFNFMKLKRWQDLDWFMFADLTFLGAAIFDVLTNTFPRLAENGSFISSIGWICNAFLYMIAGFADDCSIAVQDDKLPQPEMETAELELVDRNVSEGFQA